MSKIRQHFTRKQALYKLDERLDVLKEIDEPDDLQAKMNSHYDETLYYNLERFYEARSVELLDGIDSDDYGGLTDLTGCQADKVLRALDRVDTLRGQYNIPDTITNVELLAYLRKKAQAGNIPKTEGGESIETQTQTESQSEQT